MIGGANGFPEKIMLQQRTRDCAETLVARMSAGKPVVSLSYSSSLSALRWQIGTMFETHEPITG